MGGSRSWLSRGPWRRSSPANGEQIPRTTRARNPLWLLAPATFFQGYDNLILSLALPLIRQSFHLSLAGAGLLASVVFMGSLGSFLLLPLADRWGRRPILVLSILGYTAATFLTAFSRGVVEFAACQFVARAFLGTEYTLAIIVVVETTEHHRRGKRLGLVTSMAALGSAAAGAGYFIVNASGGSWRILYLIGIIPLLFLARAWRSLPETAPSRGTERVSLRSLSRRYLLGVSIVSFLFEMFPAAVVTLATTLFRDTWHLKLTTIPPFYFVLWLLGVSGFFVAGRALDRFGRKPVSIIVFLIGGVAGFLAFATTSMATRGVGLAFVIFATTAATPCTAAYYTELFPIAARGRVNAWLRGVGMGGQAAAPALATVLAIPLGGLGWGIAVVGLSYALAAVVIAVLLPETLNRRDGVPAGTPEEEARPYHLV